MKRLNRDNKDDPRVTVLMPVYNGEKYLREAIESILGQTFTDFEFLILDDCSTDGSAQIIESYTDPRIRFVKNEENLRLPGNLNKGLEMARGEFIARMDQDDISVAERFEIQIEFMDANPRVGLLGTYYVVMDEQGRPIEKYAQDSLPTTHRGLVKTHFKSHYIGHGTFFFRRSIVGFVDGYDETAGCTEDKDFVFRVSEHFDIANIPTVLYKWRMSEGNITALNVKSMRRYSHLAIYRALLRKADRVCETRLRSGILERTLASYYRAYAKYLKWKFRLGEFM